MFYALYCWIGRTAYKLAFPIMKRLPFAPRVRVVLLNEKKQILVVKNWFGPQTWSLPGGGVGHHETYQQAAAREVHEETGIQISQNQLMFAGTYSKSDMHAAFAAHCVKGYVAYQTPSIYPLRKLEILDAQWVDLNIAADSISSINKVLQELNSR
jgi:8-oxo-dGTP pyrophosphatase MutT (NUDIX family)